MMAVIHGLLLAADLKRLRIYKAKYPTILVLPIVLTAISPPPPIHSAILCANGTLHGVLFFLFSAMDDKVPFIFAADCISFNLPYRKILFVELRNCIPVKFTKILKIN